MAVGETQESGCGALHRWARPRRGRIMLSSWTFAGLGAQFGF